MADHVVIDTNVGIAANGDADVSSTCEVACVELLSDIVHRGHLVLDHLDQIFTEYRRHMSMRGQPGVGDVFMKWVADNRFNPDFCTQVVITPKVDDPRDFEEFPTSDRLTGFDPSDRKFVAVAATHTSDADICVAGDRDWVRHREALSQAGLRLRFLNR